MLFYDVIFSPHELEMQITAGKAVPTKARVEKQPPQLEDQLNHPS